MIYFIFFISIALFCLITFVLFAILHCSTPYDRLIDDQLQEAFLRHYTKR